MALTIDRRALLATMTAAGLMAQVQAKDAGGDIPPDVAGPGDPHERMMLWPGMPPGGAGVHLTEKVTERSPNPTAYHDRFVDHIGAPHLIVFRPAKPNGAAVLIAPGGGYVRIVLDKEGYETAHKLAALGVTCFVLHYRLPGEGWAGRADVPLQDAERAMRLIRAHAADFGIDPTKVGVMGFSAGGHVAASLITRFAAPVYPAVDGADALDARPAFACLMYPVVTMAAGSHGGSRDTLLGPGAAAAQSDAYSCEAHVPDTAPPTFIALAGDDPAVPPDTNGIALAVALHRARVPVNLHVFEAGGHGFGIGGAAGKPCAAWFDLFVTWAQSRGFIAPVSHA